MVLLSLNGIENDNIRLLSKAKYISGNNKNVMWNVTIVNVSVIFPWRNSASEYSNLITMINSDQSKRISIVEKFSVSLFLAFCMIPDESIPKQLEVYVLIESLKAHFSPSINGSLIELLNHMGTLLVMGKLGVLNSSHPPNIDWVVPTYSTFGISIVSKIDLVDLEVDLEYCGDSSSKLMVSLQKMVLRYVSTEFEEFLVSMKSLIICANKMKADMCFYLGIYLLLVLQLEKTVFLDQILNLINILIRLC
ncbi:unnamed protein product [Sphenostylis stenocarpa]|uniref:Uncharacterized protein n=1 Tax=Sphenostylis stenocarpa TaxID=92480 RepID=A0AA86VY66_9FABA|nr:unnamed protein product [Sphenostylis stenocarpa]